MRGLSAGDDMNIRKISPVLVASALFMFCGALSVRGQKSAPIIVTYQKQRVALLIGNEAYTQSPLQTPSKDAREMGDLLQKLGFRTEVAVNTTLKEMHRAIDKFITDLAFGDEGLFFYSGHGIQLDGENYLIPIDFEAKNDVDARFAAYSVSRIQDRMEKAGTKLNIIILDACRNNPFVNARSPSIGLAGMNTARGTFIAFATSPGKTAIDSPRGGNGLFTDYLIEAIKEPGLSLDQVFNVVRERVYKESGGQQLPWSVSSVIGPPYYFNPPATQSNPASESQEKLLNQPAIISLTPRPEDCQVERNCVTTVSGKWVKPRQRGKRKLHVLVLPNPSDPGQSYWVQAAPEVDEDGEWVASGVYIGQPTDPRGLPFRICVVSTEQPIRSGQRLDHPPAGPVSCVDVTRGRP